MTPNHLAMDDAGDWAATHRATIVLGCTGPCDQGRRPCTCWRQTSTPPLPAEAISDQGLHTAAPRQGWLQRLQNLRRRCRIWWAGRYLRADLLGLQEDLATTEDRLRTDEQMRWLYPKRWPAMASLHEATQTEAERLRVAIATKQAALQALEAQP